MRSPLTKRQDNFFLEYSRDRNATQAAIRAGYSRKGARVTGYRLLTNANLQQRREALGLLGLDTLADIAQNGTNEIARVMAARTLIEYAIGKPPNSKLQDGAVTLNIHRIAAQASV
jgi:phage terminase small subunit